MTPLAMFIGLVIVAQPPIAWSDHRQNQQTYIEIPTDRPARIVNEVPLSGSSGMQGVFWMDSTGRSGTVVRFVDEQYNNEGDTQ